MRNSRLRKTEALLLATTALVSGWGLPAAFADETATEQVAQATTFDITPQPLADAIAAFQQQSGWVISVDPALLAGKTSPGVSGAMAPDQALAQLLGGSGLTATATAPGKLTLALTLAEGEALAPLTVVDTAENDLALLGNVPEVYAGGQVARGGQLGMLGNKDMMETPFSTTSYTEEVIKNKQARTLSDVVDNDPSVRVISSRGGYTDQYMIRGFPVYNDDIAFNGLYGVIPRQIYSPEGAERVEVFKGPSALLNGVSPGGTIGGGLNVVPKRAGDEPLTEVTATYSSNTQFGGAFDVGRRFGDDNEFGVRINGALRDGELAADEKDQLLGIIQVGADYDGGDLRLSFDVGYQHQEFDRPQGFTYIAAGIDMPDAPDADTNVQDEWSYNETRDLFGALRGEYDITDNVTFYAAFGGSSSDQESIGRSIFVTNDDGDATSGANSIPFYRDTISAQTGLTGKAAFWGMTHEATVQASTLRSEEGFGFGFAGIPGTNIYDPSFVDTPDFTDDSIGKSNEKQLNSVAIADTIGVWDDKIQLTLGGRLQQVKLDSYNFQSGDKTGSYDEHKLTPSLGLVIRPIDQVSVYANYIEGLVPGDIAPAGTTNQGQAFAPYKTDQIEIGVKVDLDVVTASLAFFSINQPNTYTDGTNTFVSDGETRNRGVELAFAGEPVEGFRILGGVTYLDSDLDGTLGGNNDGNRAVGVPDFQANLGGEVDIPQLDGLTLTTRVIYTGEQYYDAANTQKLPDWVRWDLGARYELETQGVPITIRGNVENVMDTNYWSSAGGGYLSTGAPRTFLVSTSFNF